MKRSFRWGSIPYNVDLSRAGLAAIAREFSSHSPDILRHVQNNRRRQKILQNEHDAALAKRRSLVRKALRAAEKERWLLAWLKIKCSRQWDRLLGKRTRQNRRGVFWKWLNQCSEAKLGNGPLRFQPAT